MVAELVVFIGGCDVIVVIVIDYLLKRKKMFSFGEGETYIYDYYGVIIFLSCCISVLYYSVVFPCCIPVFLPSSHIVSAPLRLAITRVNLVCFS